MTKGPEQINAKAWETSSPSILQTPIEERTDETIPLEDRKLQQALDLIEEASMESFPASDPPSFTTCHI